MMEANATRFTAAEGGARLAAAAVSRNTLVTEHSTFIATRLVYEEAYKIRGSLTEGKQRSVYISRAACIEIVSFELQILTDLSIVKAVNYEDVPNWSDELETKQVVVCTSAVLKQMLEEKVLDMCQINVLVLDSCHLISKDDHLKFIMAIYKACEEDKRPRILALTYPLFTSFKKQSESTTEEKITNNLSKIEESQEINEVVDKEPMVEESEESKQKDSKETSVASENTKSLPKSEIAETTDKNDNNKNEKLAEKTQKADNTRTSEKGNNPEIGVYENLDDFEMYEKLEWKIEELEDQLCCHMDLAEDIDGGKRLLTTVTKPKELIIEYSATKSSDEMSEEYIQLEKYMKDTVQQALDFICDHRYDPTEIYGEDMYEEFKNIPDPTIEPKYIFKQFLYVLEQLGPYAADKAAFSLLTKLEKLKIKVPYERHFLLLCLCTSVFVQIRCYADFVFSKYDSDWVKIKTFCTPKVMRFAEILEKFQPPEQRDVKNDVDAKHIDDRNKNDVKNANDGENGNDARTITDAMLDVIDKCDFLSLSDKIENKINTLEANLKEIEELNVKNSQENNKNYENKSMNDTNDMNTDNDKTKTDCEINQNDINQKCDSKVFGFTRRSGNRTRARARVQRSNVARAIQLSQNADALCGIVFMKEPLMAKIMFMIIGDMSRSVPSLSHLSAVYCTVEDTGTELRECQRQGRKQELVLNKFRMHECNLLLATAALEEGIDLPRCNLVLRWDVPASYRSHLVCRCRARAPRACCVLLTPAGNPACDTIHHLSVYREIDQIITRKCGCGIQDEPPQSEEDHADSLTPLIKPYRPRETAPVNFKVTSDSENFDKDFCVDSGKDDLEYSRVLNAKETSDSEIVTLKSVNDEIPEKNTSRDVNEQLIANHESENVIERLNSEHIKTDDVKLYESNEKVTSEHLTKFDEIDEIKVSNGDFFSQIKKESVNQSNNLQCNRCHNERRSENIDCNCKNIGVSETKVGNIKIEKKIEDVASVDLGTAIALINRYCSKLPSDTFTRLAPQWWVEEVVLPLRNSEQTRKAYICTLRLPLNCPVKYNIVGHPMPTACLSRRMVALQACRVLHKSGELDHQLMPIGKENFKPAEMDPMTAPEDPAGDGRPGTTKRRQYYYKRTAWAFTDCQPVVDTSDSELDPPAGNAEKKPTEVTTGTKRNMLYAIVSQLWCALPERYNTRGRKLHAPQNAKQAIGILMARDEPDSLQIPSFPVYTRSGEVRVSVGHVPDADVRMSPRRGRLVRRFMRFVFAEVLRVRRRGMKLQSDGSTHNNYYIVPTVKSTRPDGSTKIDVDWPFLELIYQYTEEKKHSDIERPILWHQDEEEKEESTQNQHEAKENTRERQKMENPLLKEGEVFVFDADKYREAVVTPWYRNQDQPQFFLVAEICRNLSPDSAFPSLAHPSFRHYYTAKYGVRLTQRDQPLLDVDHTSARLNLLTARYVNRKGVALPVSSERTRRAKRDRLDQKQILVPELCKVHPFAAPLWFATVALPCVLYRINALLIADEIRRSVAIDVGLGIPKIDDTTCPGFQWPPLDFGWSLAEVLNADAEKNEKNKDGEDQTATEKELTEKQNGGESLNSAEEQKERTLNEIMQKEIENGFEIGTWSNEMASSIPDDDFLEPLPPNLTFCTSASGGTNWCDPIEKPKNQFNPTRRFSMADSDCSMGSSDFDTDDSDLNSAASDDDSENSGSFGTKNSNAFPASMGVRIEYKTAHEAEAVDLSTKPVKNSPAPDEEEVRRDRQTHDLLMRSGVPSKEYIEKFHDSVAQHKKEIIQNGLLIHGDEPITTILPHTKETRAKLNLNDKEFEKIDLKTDNNALLEELFPYGNNGFELLNGQVNLEAIERNKRVLLADLKKSLKEDDVKRMHCFSMVDINVDANDYVNEKVLNIGFDSKEAYVDRINAWVNTKDFRPYYQESKGEFDFDDQPKLEGHPGPSPSVILQALTMSNANDGINLERLETIGDSFLKFAITAYLYCAHPTVHEGKLSHMRSKQVSNLNLYRLGRSKRLGALMTASKFEPHDNWLPPCHKPPSTLHPRMPESEDQANQETPTDSTGCFIPYNLITQHSIPDKSIADCVEALIGAYLLECGPRGALLFMCWLGIRVLPAHRLPLTDDHPYVVAQRYKEQLQKPQPPRSPSPKPHHQYSSESECSSSPPPDLHQQPEDWSWTGRPVGSLRPYQDENGWMQVIYGELKAPPSPLLRYIANPDGELERMLSGYDALETTLQYRFKDRSLLLQALTHASHQQNKLTDCYQRLELLGDAILDYLITRHLYEDPRRHSPGALTDLRSALVNNTIFATLAARHGFHKYFRHMSPGLNEVLTKYVKIQEENGHSISEEHYLIQEDEMEQAEDVEVPKALGDLFESVAGAIFLDSGMSLGAVWRSYVTLMGLELEAFSAAAPKSPVRELLEAEPDTAKFGKPERLADGRRVRVCVEVFGRGVFRGVGRNYRIAKGTAARCALRHLRDTDR